MPVLVLHGIDAVVLVLVIVILVAVLVLVLDPIGVCVTMLVLFRHCDPFGSAPANARRKAAPIGGAARSEVVALLERDQRVGEVRRGSAGRCRQPGERVSA